jgi:3-phosphoshikimate 1-carboxyvinyltransferase
MLPARATSPKIEPREPVLSSHSELPPRPLSAGPCAALGGRLKPPGDKSISHRAFILGLLSVGRTEIEGLLEGDDVLRTGEACRALGARIARHGEGRWSVDGVGLGSLPSPRETLDFGNAGTGSRLMMGVVAGHDDHGHLRRRRLAAQAADAPHSRPAGADGRGRSGAGRRRPPAHHARGAEGAGPSSMNPCRLGAGQVGRAARRAERAGRTTVIETEATRDHTEKMLTAFRRDGFDDDRMASTAARSRWKGGRS